MTVKELIKELEAIENKDLPVMVFDDFDFWNDKLHASEVSEVFEGMEYFQRNGKGKMRECIKIIGE